MRYPSQVDRYLRPDFQFEFLVNVDVFHDRRLCEPFQSNIEPLEDVKFLVDIEVSYLKLRFVSINA